MVNDHGDPPGPVLVLDPWPKYGHPGGADDPCQSIPAQLDSGAQAHGGKKEEENQRHSLVA